MKIDIGSQMINSITKNKPETKVLPGPRAEYFHFSSQQKHLYVTDRLRFMKPQFLKILGLNEFDPINHQSVTSFYTFGMISSLNGDQIRDSCYFFNTIDQSSVPVKLNLSITGGFSMFNGQIVAIKGKNPSGKEIIVEKVFYAPDLEYKNFSKGELHVDVLKGPFSRSMLENSFFESNQILFFLGPFCNFKPDGFSTLDEFIECVKNKLFKLSQAKAFLIPSEEDYFSISVFPQPRISAKTTDPRITLLSNPALLSINGHYIVVSNFDSILDLCAEEVYKNFSGSNDPLCTDDKFTRIAQHLVFQRTFCPILNSKSNVSYGTWLNMENTPDIYILNSKMKQFNVEVEKTTVVNVSSMSKSRCRIEKLFGATKCNVYFIMDD